MGESPSSGARVHRTRSSHVDTSGDLARHLGATLRVVRRSRGWSLARLSDASGVSRAMLSQIELGKSAPTITVLWRIVRALGLPLSSLLRDRDPAEPWILRADVARVLTSQEGGCLSRPLFPAEGWRGPEFHELRLAPHVVEHLPACGADVWENLFVAEGSVSIEVSGESHRLASGDAAVLPAELPRSCRNDGDAWSRIYLVRSSIRAETAGALPAPTEHPYGLR